MNDFAQSGWGQGGKDSVDQYFMPMLPVAHGSPRATGARKAGISQRPVPLEGGKDLAGQFSPRHKPQAGARTEAKKAIEAPAGIQEDVLHRILVVSIVLLALLVSGEIIFQVLIAPRLRIQNISIQTGPGLEEDQIRHALGLEQDLAYYGIDEAAMEETLRRIPAVQSVVVQRIFPDSLRVEVQTRQALVLSRVAGGEGGQQAVFIDAEGYAFAWAEGLGQYGNLPVLSGIDYRNFRLGLKLPAMVVEYLKALDALRKESPDLFHGFSEFRLVPVDQRELEVLVYTMVSRVPVRTGAHLDAKQAMYILQTMNLLKEHPLVGEIRELDFRTSNLVIRRGDE